jgi:hypothetical protein
MTMRRTWPACGTDARGGAEPSVAVVGACPPARRPAQCVPDLPGYGRGNDQENDRAASPSHYGFPIGIEGDGPVGSPAAAPVARWLVSSSRQEIGCVTECQVVARAGKAVVGCTLAGAASAATWIRSRPAPFAW